MNLLSESITLLERMGYTTADVLWVGNSANNTYVSWDQFAELVKGLEYNEGFGCNNIHLDLVIVGKDWWLTRHEYDGSEEWLFNKLPIKPTHNTLDLKKDILCDRCHEVLIENKIL